MHATAGEAFMLIGLGTVLGLAIAAIQREIEERRPPDC